MQQPTKKRTTDTIVLHKRMASQTGMPFQQDFYGEAPNNPAEKRLNTNYQLKEAPMAPATGVLALNPAPRLPETRRFSVTTAFAPTAIACSPP